MIGWLFLLQVIAAFGLGAVVLVSAGSLTAAAGAVFALATLGGYLLSLWTGLFGFTEVRTTAGIAAGVIEVAAFAALTGLVAMPARRGRADSGPLARLRTGAPGTGRVVSVSVAAVASCDLQASGALQRVNARGTFVVIRQASLQLRDGGAIVNFSSSTVRLAFPSYAAYAPPARTRPRRSFRCSLAG